MNIDDRKTMRLMLHPTILICTFLLLLDKANAQKVYTYNLPGCNCYCEMVFEEKALNPQGVLVVDAQGKNILDFVASNKYLEAGVFSSYNILYINILNKGSSEKLDCYQVVINAISYTHSIQNKAFFLVQENKDSANTYIKTGPEINYNYNILSYKANDLKNTLPVLNEATAGIQYKLPEYFNNSNEVYSMKMANYKGNLELGIFYNPLFLTGKTLGLPKDFISTYGLSISKNISRSFALKADIVLGFNIPSRKSMQSEIQSKIMTAIQNEEETYILDQTISGHVLMGWDIALKYNFGKTKPFRPYISAGIGSYSITGISGKIQDTIDISDIDMSDPSSMQNTLGGGSLGEESSSGTNNLRTRYIAPKFEMGFTYRISPVTKLNVSVPLKYFMDRTSNGFTSLTWGLNMGLSFTLNPGKYPR